MLHHTTEFYARLIAAATRDPRIATTLLVALPWTVKIKPLGRCAVWFLLVGYTGKACNAYGYVAKLGSLQMGWIHLGLPQ